MILNSFDFYLVSILSVLSYSTSAAGTSDIAIKKNADLSETLAAC
jgi:hypothetical protein